MLATKLPFIQIFSSAIRPVVSEEKDRLLALASMQELSTFVPVLDFQKNIDLLGIAFDACVVNRGNKNGDIIDTDTGLALYKTFIHKFVDTEHNRQKVIGVILTAFLTEFGTNKIIREEDVRGTDTPFNITLGAVLWRAVNEDLCDLVEEANDPTSSDYMKVSASWELGFSGYKVLEMPQGSKNISEGTIITDAKEVKEIEKYLKCFGGSGVKNGKSYFRMPNENVIAMGVGLTEKPAAEVQGVAVKLPAEDETETQDAKAQVNEPLNNLENNAKIISQPQENTVKRERTVFMTKINSITDINDDMLKQCSASVITQFISDELKKASDTFTAEKTKQATANEALQETADKLTNTVSEMKASLDTLVKEKESRAKVDAFNSRMSEIVASYELPEEVSKIVADDLKVITSDEAFASYKTKAETLFKPYSKVMIAEAKAKQAKADEDAMAAKAKAEAEAKAAEEAKAAADKAGKKDGDKDDDKDKDGKKKDAKASEAIASAVDTALDNATKKDGGIPNTTGAGEEKLSVKFAQAFAEENFVIKV